MTTIHHIYACSREEPTKRVLMYECGPQLLPQVIRTLGLFCGPDDKSGYMTDSLGGLWWVKSYGGAA